MTRRELAESTPGGEKRRHPKAVLALAVGLLALALSLAACAPNATTASMPATGDAAEEQAADADGADDGLSFSTAKDFTEHSTGLYPDIQRNAEFQNSGNRGCAACHEDLFTLDKNNGTFVHITNQVGMKKGTYNGDCAVCHFSKAGTAGNIMSENIHVRHYGSTEFVNANGNCWSCHVTDTDENGSIVMKLFEDIQYDARYGGYPNEDDVDIDWLERHGWEEGTFSGVVRLAEPNVSFEVDQAASAEEKEFNILNFELIDGEDTYDQLEKAVQDGSYTLKVTGVGKPGEYTLADLKAMPQTEFTGAQMCLVAGYNTAMLDNMPMKGVRLADFLEAVGGVEPGANTITPVACDGWTAIFPGGSTDLQAYLDNDAILITEAYGHDLTIYQGGPVKIFVPGTGGTATVRNLTELNFSKTDDPQSYSDVAAGLLEVNKTINLNTSWFDNDGVQAKVGQPLTLEGAAWGWTFGDEFDYAVDKIMFSFDYGKNWVEVDSPDDFDPYQWTHYTMTWTPEKAGTYVVKAKAVTADGVEQGKHANLIVQVSE
ncbi:MAG: molybdopterin-dependent oxidoreductase [Adlercreutzia sp.]|nr:molybdopterin-dependent oxidoreductase [Adlercreutzia sp.]